MMSARSDIKAPTYPIVVAGNRSFPRAQYKIGTRKLKDLGENSDQAGMILDHNLENARLITNLIHNEDACYACAIASPKAWRREFHISTTGSAQELRWDIRNYGDKPYFTPMIVAKHDIHKITLSSEDHDVLDFLNDAEVHIPKGARLAVYPVFRLRARGLSGMVNFVTDKSIENVGILKIIDRPTQDDFRFEVKCHEDFVVWMRRGGDSMVYQNVDALVVEACLSILRKDYSGTDSNGNLKWENHDALVRLADHLEGQGCKRWWEDSFDSLETATKLHPYKWQSEVDTDV